MSVHTKHFYAFGPFRLDCEKRVLVRDGTPVPLAPKAAETLLVLVENAGHLVDKDELMERVWPDAFVEEVNLAKNVFFLRQILGEWDGGREYIETVPKRGYRFVAPVEEVTHAEGAPEVRSPAGRNLIGKKISHYRVLEVIGGGGMGMVYKAEDLKLGRRVALKFLPEELTSDPVALQRFEREAQTASSLNHPNICTIYEFGEHAGQPFLVMELLEGETLRDHLAVLESKATPLDQLLNTALQICDGLQAAHESEIIHRDIKPANIFLTAKGTAKILDFGLAKLMDIERGAPDASPRSSPEEGLERGTQARDDAQGSQAVEGPGPSTSSGQAFSPANEKEKGSGLQPRPEPRPEPGLKPVSGQDADRRAEARRFHPPATPVDPTLTRTGAAMGTAGYMSPEQVRGEKLDARTDIFSFGLVLYEMATGRRAFTGATAAVVHNAILNTTPVPVRELNSTLPAKLVMAIDKALEKDREQRYQSAAEIHADLWAVRQETTVTTGERKSRARRRLAALVLIALTFCLVGFFFLRSKRLPETSRAASVERQLTANSPDNPVIDARVSPDGKHLAYTDRASGLSVLRIDTGETRSYAGTSPFRLNGWTPDGDHVLLTKLRETGIWQVSILDGAIRKVRDDAASTLPSPDGKRSLIRKEDGIWVRNSDGTERKVISADSTWTIDAWTWSPTSQRIAYLRWTQSSEWNQTEKSPVAVNVETCDLEGGQRTTVLSDTRLYGEGSLSSLQWLADGRILYSLREPPNANVWALQVDPDTGLVRGQQQQLTHWVGISDYASSTSTDGKRLVLQRYQTRNIVRIAEIQANGELRKSRPLSSDIWPSYASGWSPDSHTVLITANRHGKQGIFEQNLSDAHPEPLVSGPGDFDSPVVSPDGKWLLYTEYVQNRPAQLMRVSLQGGPATLILSGRFSYRCASSPSTLCLMAEAKGEQLVFFALDPVNGRGPQQVATKLESGRYVYMHLWSLSPDGRVIAVVSGDSGEQIRLLATSGGITQTVSLNGWDSLQAVNWSSDGKHVYVSGLNPVSGDWGILEVSLAGQVRVLTKVPGDRAWVNLPISSPDGRYLVWTEKTWESNVVMLENF